MGRKRRRARRREKAVTMGKGGFGTAAPREKTVKTGGGFSGTGGGFHEDAPHKVRTPRIRGVKLY